MSENQQPPKDDDELLDAMLMDPSHKPGAMAAATRPSHRPPPPSKPRAPSISPALQPPPEPEFEVVEQMSPSQMPGAPIFQPDERAFSASEGTLVAQVPPEVATQADPFSEAPSTPIRNVIPDLYEQATLDSDTPTPIHSLAEPEIEGAATESDETEGEMVVIEDSEAPPDMRSASECIAGREDPWLERAEKLALDSSLHEGVARARRLVIASELCAIAGATDRAVEHAEEAWKAAPKDAIVLRQLRQLLCLQDRWEDVAPLLETETEIAPNVASAVHTLLLSAEAARMRDAPEDVERALETAQKKARTDVRVLFERSLLRLGNPKLLPATWPSDAEDLHQALRARCDGEPTTELALAYLADSLNGHDFDALSGELTKLRSVSELSDAAGWLQCAIDAAQPDRQQHALQIARSLPVGNCQNEVFLTLGVAQKAYELAIDAAERMAASNPESIELAAAHLAVTCLAKSRLQASLEGLQKANSPLLARSTAFALGDSQRISIDDALDPYFELISTLDSQAPSVPLTMLSQPIKDGFALVEDLTERPPKALEALAGSVSASQGDIAFGQFLLAGSSTANIDWLAKALEDEPSNFGIAETWFQLDPVGGATVLQNALSYASSPNRAAATGILLALHAHQQGDLLAAKAVIHSVSEAAPADPVLSFLGEITARKLGDSDDLFGILEQRTSNLDDPKAIARERVRAALVNFDAEKIGLAASQLEDDTSVQALVHRSALADSKWLLRIAERSTGAIAANAYLDSAYCALADGDFRKCAERAWKSEQIAPDFANRYIRRYCDWQTENFGRLVDEGLAAAKELTDPQLRMQLFSELALLDESRADNTSATLWNRSILEIDPVNLPAHRSLEHLLLADNSDDDFCAIEAALARLLPPAERDAHAEIATQLTLRKSEAHFEEVFPLVELACETETPSLWATRMMDTVGRMRREDKTVIRACDLLLARTEHPQEIATLSVRIAEAHFRQGNLAEVRKHLDKALDYSPAHPTALASLAELQRQAGEFAGAAETLERLAAAQVVRAHQIEDWLSAGAIWLDRLHDSVRARAAFEQAGELDLAHPGVFERLVELFVSEKDIDALTDIFNRRLDSISEDDLRAKFQVRLASLLVQLGDPSGARVALGAVLEGSPENQVALREALRLAEEAEDWGDVEQLLTKLSRAVGEGPEQIEILAKLGTIYEQHQPNPSRAQAVYLRILEADDRNEAARSRLVNVYIELGDVDMAIESQQERVKLATTPSAKRDLLLQLAGLFEEHTNDPARTEKTLLAARAIDPANLQVLEALAGFYVHQGYEDRANTSLEEAVSAMLLQLETALDIPVFEQLASVYELRNWKDLAGVTRGVATALSGGDYVLPALEDAAGISELDDMLCPAELSPQIRAFFARVGDALEKSIAIDLRGLRAAKLGGNHPEVKSGLDVMARSFGLSEPDVLVSRAMPHLCLPVSFKPFQLVLGDGVLQTHDDITRRFALFRAMKLCAAHCSVLVRVPPQELDQQLRVLLHILLPNDVAAPEMDAERLDEMQRRLQRFIPRKEEGEIREVAASAFTGVDWDVERLAAAAGTWGDRIGFLAVGRLVEALRGVAWTYGEADIPHDQLVEWCTNHPVARDIILFAISRTHLSAREVTGVAL